MQRIRTAVALTVGILGSTLLVAPSAGQETDPAPDGAAPTATVEPTSGPAGAEVLVRGTGCKHEEKGLLGSVSFGFRSQLDEADHPLLPLVDNRVGPTGGWVTTLAIPMQTRLEGKLVDVPPGDGYAITAMCVFEELGSDEWIRYDDMAFEVTASATPLKPGDESASLTPPGDSSTSRTALPDPSTPAPASPLPGTPTVTG